METQVKSEVRQSRIADSIVNVCKIVVRGFSDIDKLVDVCADSESFRKELKKWGIYVSDKHSQGGFSQVLNFENGTVLKMTSFRKSYPSNQPLDRNLCDWFENLGDAENTNPSKLFLDFMVNRESYIHKFLTDEQKNALLKTFIIKVCDDCDNVLDYFICVNMPKFISLEDAFNKKPLNEKSILEMAYDVLTCLEKVHYEGVRHRDVKTKNIMFDEATGKFILTDWGSSSIPTDLDILRELLNSNFATLSTYFIKPYADVTDIKIDIFPLGVVMAFLAHPLGHSVGHNISELYNSVCPDYVIDVDRQECKIITPEIYTGLTNSSDEFKEIVKKAMNDEYSNVSQMLADVEKILYPDTNPTGTSEEKKETDVVNKTDKTDKTDKVSEIKTPFYEKILKFNLIFEAIPPILIVIFTWLLAKEDAFYAVEYEKGGVAVSIMIAIFCFVIPVLLHLLKYSRGKRVIPSVKIKANTLIVGAALYLACLLSTNLILGFLSEYASVDINCTLYLVTLFLTWVMTKISSKNKNIGFLLAKCLVSGGLAGLASGICVSAGLSRGNFSNVFSEGNIGLICSVVLFFIVCSLCVFYVIYKIRTKAVKVTDFK